MEDRRFESRSAVALRHLFVNYNPGLSLIFITRICVNFQFICIEHKLRQYITISTNYNMLRVINVTPILTTFSKFNFVHSPKFLWVRKKRLFREFLYFILAWFRGKHRLTDPEALPDGPRAVEPEAVAAAASASLFFPESRKFPVEKQNRVSWKKICSGWTIENRSLKDWNSLD